MTTAKIAYPVVNTLAKIGSFCTEENLAKLLNKNIALTVKRGRRVRVATIARTVVFAETWYSKNRFRLAGTISRKQTTRRIFKRMDFANTVVDRSPMPHGKCLKTELEE